jgi:hypothetical protein
MEYTASEVFLHQEMATDMRNYQRNSTPNTKRVAAEVVARMLASPLSASPENMTEKERIYWEVRQKMNSQEVRDALVKQIGEDIETIARGEKVQFPPPSVSPQKVGILGRLCSCLAL